MFRNVWTLGILFFVISTILRYVLIRTIPHKNKLIQLFLIDTKIFGVEAMMFMGQLVGITWIFLGIFFDKIFTIANINFRNIIDMMIFYGPFGLYGWILYSRIKIRR